jgi:hypothetical protein
MSSILKTCLRITRTHNTGGLFSFTGVFQYIFFQIILPSINTHLCKLAHKQNMIIAE